MSNVIIYDTYNINVTIEENEVIGVQVVAGFIHDVIAGSNISIDKTDPLNPIISSSGSSVPLLTDWDMDTNLFPAGSVKGQEYYGVITTSSTLVDVNGDPLPSKIFATSLVNGASTTDPSEWAFTYTIN